MHKNNFYISFGVWIAIIPFLGIPRIGINALVTLSGIFLILVSLGPTILKKLQARTKSKKKTELIKRELKFSDNSSAVQGETRVEQDETEVVN
jgi:hypothetical protein